MPTIRELVEEAEENYGTGRLANSSQLFKRAALETLSKQVIPDALYLAYRSIHDFKEMEDTTNMVNLLMPLIRLLQKSVIRLCSEEIERGTTDEIIPLLKIQIQALHQLGQEEEVEPVIEILQSELQRKYKQDKNIEHLLEAYEISEDENILVQALTAVAEDFIDSKGKIEDTTQYRDLSFIVSQTQYLTCLQPRMLENITLTRFNNIDELQSDAYKNNLGSLIEFNLSVISSYYHGVFSPVDRVEEIQEFIGSQFARYNLSNLLEVIRRGDQ